MATTTSQTRPTMQDLLQKVDDNLKITVGEKVTGTIIFLAKNQCLINIHDQTLGIVRGRELYNEEFLSKLKIGEEIEAIVLELDNEIGMLELSFRAIGRDRIWNEILQAHEDKATVSAKVREVNRGGFLVKVHGVDGFLPASLLSPTHAIKNVGVEDTSLSSQMKKYLGQSFNVKILNINEENESIIVSEKAVSDEIASQNLAKYKVGDIIEGEVVGVVDFGLFVRFDEDLEGLIHISEIAWKKVEDPKKEFKLGQKVSAKIVEIDKDNRVNLSIKQTLANPWINFSKKNKPGDEFEGVVAKIVSYGAIIVNDEDIQGLCHISQISEDHIENPAKIHDYIKVGAKMTFKILSLESDEKLYLTLLDFDKALEIQKHLAVNSEEQSENYNDESE